MIEIAEGKGRACAIEGLSFAVRPAHELPAGPVDAVLTLNLLHLVEDLGRTLEAVHRALPPGGTFVSKTALLKDGAWFLPLAIRLMRAVGKAPFVRGFREADFLERIRAAGFAIEEAIRQPGTAPRLFVVARKA